jgi:Tfp pilus assembly protein PilV
VKRPARLPAGFAYVELLIAVLLLALCALPAANAVRNGLNAAEVVPARAKQLHCMRNMMETVLAEPYEKLLSFENGDKISAYPVPEGDGCVERQVYIGVYEQNGGARSTALLRVDVVSPDTDYAFTTLVSP